MSAAMINDEQLNKVTGGIMDEDIASKQYHKEAICPNCHSGDQVILTINAGLGLKPEDIHEKYYCKRCSVTFNID